MDVTRAEVEDDVDAEPDISEELEGFEFLWWVPPVDPEVERDAPAEVQDKKRGDNVPVAAKAEGVCRTTPTSACW
jgi:hypothetical protein